MERGLVAWRLIDASLVAAIVRGTL